LSPEVVKLEDLTRVLTKALEESPGHAPTVADLLRHVDSCPECGKVFDELMVKKVKEKGFLSKEEAEKWLEEKKKEWVEKGDLAELIAKKLAPPKEEEKWSLGGK